MPLALPYAALRNSPWMALPYRELAALEVRLAHDVTIAESDLYAGRRLGFPTPNGERDAVAVLAGARVALANVRRVIEMRRADARVADGR